MESAKLLTDRQTDRQTWIDAVKGFGILLVILGHTFNVNSLICKFIYSFHMPMFFIVAGYLFNNKKYGDMKITKYIKIKAKSYLFPYFIYSFINLVLQIFWNLFFYKKFIGVKQILDYVFAILYCYAGESRMPNCSSVWFLMCLFWASMLFWIINKYAEKFTFIFAALSLCISYCIGLFIDFRLPFNLPTAFMAVFFMWLGLLLKKYDLIGKVSGLNAQGYTFLFVIVVIFGLIAGYFNIQVGMNENNYGNLMLFLLSSILLSFAVMIFSNRIRFFRNRYFIYLGKNTMLIIGFNFFIRDFITEMYYILPISKIITYNWVISFILTTIAFTVIIYFHNRIKSRFKRSFL